MDGTIDLVRIDKESPERAYHSTVVEVLTAYVRENAPWPSKSSNKSPERSFIKPPEGDSVSHSAPNKAAQQDKGAEQGGEPTSGSPRTDIQAVLDVLKRREEDRVPEKHRVLLDLRGTDLQGAILYKANLQRAILQDAFLQDAFLQEAILQEADLRHADVTLDQLAKAASLEGATMPAGTKHD